jgi:flagellar motor switch/type III secretory pathway protein FliN
MTSFSTQDFDEQEAEALQHELEWIEPGLAALRRAAFSGRDMVPFDFGGTQFRLRFVDSSYEFDAKLELRLRVGREQGRLLIESFDAAGEEWSGVFDRLDPTLVRALLIEEMSTLFERLAGAAEESVQLIDVQVACNSQGPLLATALQSLRIENHGNNIGVQAVLHADTPGFFGRVAALLRRLPPRAVKAPDAACLVLQIVAGSVRLGYRDMAQTQAGDILVLPAVGTLASLQCACRDRNGRRLALGAMLEGRTGRLTRLQGEMKMGQANRMNMTNEADVVLDDPSAIVTAVIGELELPLSAFASLGAGYVFELPMDVAHAAVRLFTGSGCVGTGRLVAVGDRLGIRILEWGGDGDGYDA